jgi:type IV pilus assembly protein PilM
MSTAELAEAIPWEAEQYIPFALTDVQLDYQVLDGPRSMPAEALDVLLVAARRDRLNERTAAIAATGRRTVVLDVEAFALANAYEMNYPDRTDNLAALVHVGRTATLVCVLEQGQAAFTRDISLGGGAYLEALERESGLDGLAAQRVMRGLAAPGSEGVSSVLRDVHQQLVLEIRKTLDFYWSAAKPASLDRIVLSGGACQVDGLSEMIAAEFQTEVDRCDPFRRISRPASIEADGPAYAVAVGLAMRRERDR